MEDRLKTLFEQIDDENFDAARLSMKKIAGKAGAQPPRTDPGKLLDKISGGETSEEHPKERRTQKPCLA